MNLNHYMTNDYENKSGLLTMVKQTQSNPIYSDRVESTLLPPEPFNESRQAFFDGRFGLITQFSGSFSRFIAHEAVITVITSNTTDNLFI